MAGEGVFEECDLNGLTAWVAEGSAAEAYCRENGIRVRRSFPGAAEITLPRDTIAVEAEAFAGCAAMKSVAIPEGVQSIGDGAFRNCAALQYVLIPESVDEFGSDVFAGCPSDLVVCVVAGSAAETYCEANHIDTAYMD